MGILLANVEVVLIKRKGEYLRKNIFRGNFDEILRFECDHYVHLKTLHGEGSVQG